MRVATQGRGLFAAVVLFAAAGARSAPPDDLAAIGDRCVIDQARLLTAVQARQLLDLCKQLNRGGIAQLAVATVTELGDRVRKEYAVDLFKKWKLGHGKKRSDGLLILVAPSTSSPWGISVEVGYGLEGVLPDGKVGRLLDESWVPARDKRAYGEGIVAAAQALAGVLAKDAAAGGDAAPTEESRAIGGQRGGGAESGASPLGLGLAVLSMLALLIVLATSAMRRTFPGKGTGLLAAGLGVATVIGLIALGGAAGWFALIAGVVINGITFFSIRSHKCPKDGSWMIIEEEVLEHPTYFSEGVAQVWEHCTNAKCGHERTFEKVLPRKQVHVSGGGGGGGGGGSGSVDSDSGGGGGGSVDSDSFSGGGGESGGGGADRD